MQASYYALYEILGNALFRMTHVTVRARRGSAVAATRYRKLRRYTIDTPLVVPASARSVTCRDSAYSSRSALDASDSPCS